MIKVTKALQGYKRSIIRQVEIIENTFFGKKKSS